MYNLDKLKQKFPATQLKLHRPGSNDNPNTTDLLEYGSYTELIEAVQTRAIPEPWMSAVLLAMPHLVPVYASGPKLHPPAGEPAPAPRVRVVPQAGGTK